MPKNDSRRKVLFRRWKEIEPIFESALELEQEPRARFLDRACGGDAELRSEIEALFASLQEQDSLLDGSPVMRAFGALGELASEDRERHTAASAEPADGFAGSVPGRRLGAYHLDEEIGRGGMAVVYCGHRSDGAFEQQVAVKILAPGLVQTSGAERFHREQGVLARLRHPRIASMLDGGVAEDGTPFLVMELIEGRPIDRHCNEEGSSIAERVELLRRVSEAVAFAHRSLIVHRDLKPSNVLVTAEGEVKLLDFGIAKLLDEESRAAQLTVTGQRWLTPDYAAPEQVAGGEVTTATDVYGLGVVAYELLTGSRPLDLAGLSPAAAERKIRDQEPERPSTAVTRTRRGEATTSQTGPPPDAARWLRGDLDAIVLKALAKEPERRYGSARELAEDLRRHQQGLPVEARQPTLRYRLGKMARRHRAALTAAAAVAAGAALLISFYTLSLQRERDQARIEAQKAERVAELLAGLFESSDPFAESGAEDLRGRELLDRGAARVEEELGEEPEVQAAMLRVLGDVYQSLGLYDEARPLLERSLALRRDSPFVAPAEVAASLRSLGKLLGTMEEHDASEALLRESLDIERARAEESLEVASGLVLLGNQLLGRGDYEGAESLHRQALELRRRLLGDDDVRVGESLHELARALAPQGEYVAAADLERQTLDVYRRHFGAEHPHVAVTLNNVAYLTRRAGEYEEAESLYRQSLDLQRRLLPADHPRLATVLTNLGILVWTMGRYDESEPLHQEALEINRRRFGESHPQVGRALQNLAALKQAQGDLEQAADYADRAMAIAREAFQPPHRSIASGLNLVGSIAWGKGDYPRAEQYYREALSMTRQLYGEEHELTIREMNNVGATLRIQGKSVAAEHLLRQAIEIGRRALGEDHPTVSHPLRNLGQLLGATGRFEEAETALLEALEIQTKKGLEADLPKTRRALADLYEASGRPHEAAEVREDGVESN